MYDLIVAKKVKLYDRDTAIKNAGTWHPNVPHFFDFSKFTWNSHFADGYEAKKNALLKEVERILNGLCGRPTGELPGEPLE